MVNQAKSATGRKHYEKMTKAAIRFDVECLEMNNYGVYNKFCHFSTERDECTTSGPRFSIYCVNVACF